MSLRASTSDLNHYLQIFFTRQDAKSTISLWQLKQEPHTLKSCFVPKSYCTATAKEKDPFRVIFCILQISSLHPSANIKHKSVFFSMYTALNKTKRKRNATSLEVLQDVLDTLCCEPNCSLFFVHATSHSQPKPAIVWTKPCRLNSIRCREPVCTISGSTSRHNFSVCGNMSHSGLSLTSGYKQAGRGLKMQFKNFIKTGRSFDKYN